MNGMTEGEAAAFVDRALSLEDENARWDIVSKLHDEGGRAAFDAAERLCGAGDAERRRLGADILGQVGFTRGGGASEGPFRDEAMRVLLDLVEREGEPEVLDSICVAFGHLADPRSVGPLVRLRGHRRALGPLGPLREWRAKLWEASDPMLLDEALEALGEAGKRDSGGEQGGA